MDGLSIGSLILIIVLAILLFGSKRLRGLGEDVGKAITGFRKGMREVEDGKKDIQEVMKSENLQKEEESVKRNSSP